MNFYRKNKIIGVTLSLLLALTTICFKGVDVRKAGGATGELAWENVNSGSKYSLLNDALTDADNEDTLKLNTKNVNFADVTQINVPKDKTITIDLNKNKINFNYFLNLAKDAADTYCFGMGEDSRVNFKNGTIGFGDTNTMKRSYDKSRNNFYLAHNSKMYFEDVTVFCMNSNKGSVFACQDETGFININKCTFKGSNSLAYVQAQAFISYIEGDINNHQVGFTRITDSTIKMQGSTNTLLKTGFFGFIEFGGAFNDSTLEYQGPGYFTGEAITHLTNVVATHVAKGGKQLLPTKGKGNSYIKGEASKINIPFSEDKIFTAYEGIYNYASKDEFNTYLKLDAAVEVAENLDKDTKSGYPMCVRSILTSFFSKFTQGEFDIHSYMRFSYSKGDGSFSFSKDNKGKTMMALGFAICMSAEIRETLPTYYPSRYDFGIAVKVAGTDKYQYALEMMMPDFGEVVGYSSTFLGSEEDFVEEEIGDAIDNGHYFQLAAVVDCIPEANFVTEFEVAPVVRYLNSSGEYCYIYGKSVTFSVKSMAAKYLSDYSSDSEVIANSDVLTYLAGLGE